MKNNIALKFLAVLVCALTLLTSILCIIGIAALEKAELYEQDYQAQYQSHYDTLNQRAATELARRQLSRHLGGCDDALLDVLDTQDWLDQHFRQGSYFYTIRALDGEVLYTDYNGVTQTENIEVRVTSGYYYRQLAVTASDVEDQFEGNPVFHPTDPSAPTENPVADTVHIFVEKLGIYMAYTYQREVMPTVTVTLHLLPDARLDAELYDLALLLWQNRYNLFLILAGSLLLFAIGAVYLCCAAGRKPGSEEIRARGFNALPLDLYTLGCAFCLFLAYEVAQEIGYWFSASQIVFFMFFLFLGFFCCLLFVAWCFAWAAQIKEGNGRWWRKSVMGWTALELIKILGEAITTHIPNFFHWLGRSIVRLYRGIRKILVFLATEISGVLQWFFLGLWGIFVKILGVLVKAVRALWASFLEFCRWVRDLVHRALSLLPLTWQWLLVGFVLVLMLYICLRSYKTGWLLVGFGIFFAAVLYGAHAFGVLMEAARRMSRGDLDTKVADSFLLGAFRDFAEDLNALGGSAKLAAQKEMRSERMKTELITNVSHDIKTPLTSIINYVDLLQKPHTPEEELEYLEVLGRKSEQLKKLIQDLMEMSKASTGNIAVDIRPLDAGEAVNQALGEFADKLDACRLTPVVTLPEVPVTMLADGRLVWRVLSNLLSNAVKYALPGTRLYVDVARSGDTVRISLKNVSAQPLNMDAEELMERFVRGDVSRNTDGSGLGLNIARSLMEVQQGRLTLSIDGDLFKASLTLPAG